MIPGEVLTGLRQIVTLLEDHRDGARRNVAYCEKKGDEINRAYWVGKFNATASHIGILRDRIDSWEQQNEEELEKMAEEEFEKSEKDALWEGRE